MHTVKWLYEKRTGRAVLKFLTLPFVSKTVGAFMDSKCSKFIINPFVKSNKIDMSDYEERKFKSFNDFFVRNLKAGARVTDTDFHSLVSPCDGFLTCYDIDKNLTFEVKNTRYSTESLLCDKKLAGEFLGGMCLVFRLTPSNYHRYCYFDNGRKGRNVFIQGMLHTVAPIAFENGVEVFKTNSREYTVMETENFGKCVQMEVGAMMVGRIVNYHREYAFLRGEEKGRFEFGGSTVILLLQKGAAQIDEKILRENKNGNEFPVKLGQKIGNKY